LNHNAFSGSIKLCCETLGCVQFSDDDDDDDDDDTSTCGRSFFKSFVSTGCGATSAEY
jgi:hypothetical protein